MAKPRRILYPPIWLLLGLIAIWLLQKYLPIIQYDSNLLTVAGVVLMVLGAVLDIWSAGLFTRAKTPLIPFTQSSAVVSSGPYRFTRNPMYLGMALILLGAVFFFGAVSGSIIVPLFMLVIQKRFIEGEERHMEALLGEEYLIYKQRVRRWL